MDGNIESGEDVNNIDATEGACGDKKKKTIVDTIFEDFSTTPFNSPTTSPESKLRNLERSPLFILREKPKRNYSREFKEKWKSNLKEKIKVAVDDNFISESFQTDIKDRMESSAQVGKVNKTTAFQTANGKNVLISEKGKKRMEALLNKFHQSDGDIEDSLLSIKIKKEKEYHPKLGRKLSPDEKKPNIKLENDEGSGEMGSDYANIVLSQWVLLKDNSKQFLCQQTDDTLLALNDESKQTGHSTLSVPMLPPNELCETPYRNLLQIETTTPELEEFVKNAVETSTPCINKKLPLQEMEMEKDPDTVSMIDNSRFSTPPLRYRSKTPPFLLLKKRSAVNCRMVSLFLPNNSVGKMFPFSCNKCFDKYETLETKDNSSTISPPVETPTTQQEKEQEKTTEQTSLKHFSLDDAIEAFRRSLINSEMDIGGILEAEKPFYRHFNLKYKNVDVPIRCTYKNIYEQREIKINCFEYREFEKGRI
ncbi:hypothetical protein GQX74_000145 [Glossina fuscipes]|nr:hypothetical protein GQX74_000145 [Glossina fuscipes]